MADPDGPAAALRRVAPNVRDLGDLPVEGGTAGRTLPGRVWRAGNLSALGASGRAALFDLGIVTVVDLRQQVEREQHPDDLKGLGIAHQAVGVLEDDFAADPRDGLAPIYARIVRTRGPQLAAAVRHVAASPGPVLVHCSAGKDRTGIVCALLLAAAGVPEPAIARDYARTTEMLTAEDRERIVRRAVESGVDEQVALAGLGSPIEAMQATLALLHDEHGGPVAYLREHGVTDGDLAAVRLLLTAE